MGDDTARRERPDVLSAIDLHLSIGGRPLLTGASLTVAPGEMVAVTGPSGSGKSSLLGVLAGLVPAGTGRVRLCGVDLAATSARGRARVRREGMALLLQRDGLFTALDVRDNVLLGAHLAGRAPSAGDAAAALAAVGLSGRGGDRPEVLSGGERQRVAIARVLLQGAPVVLADEPTEALDGPAARHVAALLRGRAGAGCGVVVVTHDHHVTAAAHRVLALQDGVLHEVSR